jgi:hypothetical protein
MIQLMSKEQATGVFRSSLNETQIVNVLVIWDWLANQAKYPAESMGSFSLDL